MTNQNQLNNCVLVFGTFDLFHPGHDAFLRQAKQLGTKLVVSLPSDATVEYFKGRPPSQSFEERKRRLLETEIVDEVIESDALPGSFHSIEKAMPDIIAFGYDQNALKESLEEWLKSSRGQIETVVLNPYKPERYKTSLQDV